MHSTQATLQVVSPTSIDLAVSKTASPNPGQVGAGLSYRIVVTNSGPANATNVTMTDNLPAGVTFGSATSTQGNCVGNGLVTCSLGTVASLSNAIVTIVVTPSAQGQLVNTASVTATETDFDSTNNSATATTPIQPAAISPIMLDPNLTVNSGLPD